MHKCSCCNRRHRYPCTSTNCCLFDTAACGGADSNNDSWWRNLNTRHLTKQGWTKIPSVPVWLYSSRTPRLMIGPKKNQRTDHWIISETDDLHVKKYTRAAVFVCASYVGESYKHTCAKQMGCNTLAVWGQRANETWLNLSSKLRDFIPLINGVGVGCCGQV